MYWYILYGLLIFVAAFVGVVAGFGFATISLAVLSLYLPFKTALLVVAILHLFVSSYKVMAFKGAFNRYSFLFVLGGVIFSFVAAQMVDTLSSPLLKKGMGFFLILYPLLIFYKPKFHIHFTQPAAFIGGSLSGFFAGLIGMGGAVRSFFLSLFNLPKQMYIATGGLVSIAIDVTRVGVYMQSSDLNMLNALQLVLFSAPFLLLGLFLGKKMVFKIPQHYFRTLVTVVLALFGMRLLFM